MSWLDALQFSQRWCGLLTGLPLLLWLWRSWRPGTRPAVVFSRLSWLSAGSSWKTATLWVPKALVVMAWGVLCVAMMGPRLGHKETKVTTEGIAIAMVLDTSGSMIEGTLAFGAESATRLEMSERMFKDFVRGNRDLGLKGRANDMIGLVTFNRFVQEQCPLTLDHDFLMDLVQDATSTVSREHERLQQARSQQEVNNSGLAGTALYEGMALGADMLNKSEQSLKEALRRGEGQYSIASKVLIVLTDGEDNASQINHEDAIRIAKEFDVRIYTIAVLGQRVQTDIFGRRLQSQASFDDTRLRVMAEKTGGQSFRAEDAEGLARIYTEIDALEKTRIDQQVSMEYEPFHQPFVLAGLLLLAMALLLRESVYRVIP